MLSPILPNCLPIVGVLRQQGQHLLPAAGCITLVAAGSRPERGDQVVEKDERILPTGYHASQRRFGGRVLVVIADERNGDPHYRYDLESPSWLLMEEMTCSSELVSRTAAG